LYEFAEYSVPAVSATAAAGTDGRNYVSVANLDPDESAEITLGLDAGRIRNAQAQILTADQMDAHNTFDSPDNVEPAPFEGLAAENGQLLFELPAKSILMISFDN
jgi:alpha-N-arabinofuranosidase